MDLIWPVDYAGQHRICVALGDGRISLELIPPEGERRARLHRVLRQTLFVTVGGDARRFNTGETVSDKMSFDLREITGAVSIGLGYGERSVRLADVQVVPQVRLDGLPYTLSPFELRFLAANEFPHPGIGDTTDVSVGVPATDLHTHFAGCVRGDDLIAIGLAIGAKYPRNLLLQANIHTEGADHVALADLPETIRQGLARRLAVPVDRRATFAEMEMIYRLRAPITKHPQAFIPLCRQIAADYAAMGVHYIELSLSNVVEAAVLRAVHQELPAIEAENGVAIRFLAALSRHDDFEWDLDYIEQLKRAAGSHYIAGIDFMGHETNSTRSFARQLRLISAWAATACPGFVIRVHAGENPAHPENIRVALQETAGGGARLRIGHGLFGVDDTTLDQLRESKAIVEFNLNSNLALNNILSSREVPLRRYLDAGVPVVLGTDGYGIYQTTAALEARAARLSGVTRADLDRLGATESEYVERRRRLEAANLPFAAAFAVQDDLAHIHYTPAVIDRARAERKRRSTALMARLAELKIPILSHRELVTALGGRRCISFSGAWQHSWERISPAEQLRTTTEIETLITRLDPNRDALVTGGTIYGVEGIVQQLARARGFMVAGILVEALPPDALAPQTLTCATIVAEELQDKAAGLYQLMQELDGVCVFIGGGHIVSDEIQAAVNLCLNYLIMEGPKGASSDHAYFHRNRSFKTAAEALCLMDKALPWRSTNEPYWHVGVNPSVDIVVIRDVPDTRQRQVLLIRRDDDADCEPGKWALPGGFQQTDAPRGAPWSAGRESAREAALRELREETGLDLSLVSRRLRKVGEYEGGGRDPRDTAKAWSRTTVFAVHLPPNLAAMPIAGGDDASDAAWFDLDPPPRGLAFDHGLILRDLRTSGMINT
jgi:ADP-ribose pyrophosphatase YjhB (NUDIX family)/adenosine deaminase